MPRTIDDIINHGERLMEQSENNLLKSIEDAEPDILKEVMRLFDTIDVSAGKIQNTPKAVAFLASVEDKIYNALRRGGYPESIKTFVKSFDHIQNNIIDLHDTMNGERISKSQIEPYKKIEVNNTISKLTENGLAKDFVNPVRQALYRNILTGASITETQKFLTDAIKTSTNADGKLLRYVKQVARDSVSQFDGTVQANIAKDIGLNGGRYVGSLIKDSRAQCMKWVTENGGLWRNEDLMEEIRWAKSKGTYKGKVSSGMIDETTVQTFAIYRGGFNCRHRFIPTYIKK